MTRSSQRKNPQTQVKPSKNRFFIAEDLSREHAEDLHRAEALRQVAQFFARSTHAEIHLVHVEDFAALPGTRTRYDAYFSGLLKKRSKRLQQLEKKFQVPVASHLLEGSPKEEIIKLLFSSKLGLDEGGSKRRGELSLLGVGTHGYSGVKRLLLGSVAEELLRHSPIPVLTLGVSAQEAVLEAKSRWRDRTTQKTTFLVPTDLSPRSKGAESFALEFAKQMGGEIIFFHSLFQQMHPVLQTAFSSPSGRRELSQLTEELHEKAEQELAKRVARAHETGVSARALISDETLPASTLILRAIRNEAVHAVIMGTRARHLFLRGFLGSTAREVILRAPAPVITLRS